MGKKSTGNAGRSGPAKAGKRHGNITYPSNASPERIRAKEQGESQFIARKQLTVPVEKTVIEYDKALKAFVYRTKTIHISTEFVLDPRRGRVVYSPSYKEKSSK